MKNMNKGISLPKFNDIMPNEDSFFVSDNCIAISDGAGGCGLYSDEWSQYLINNLPKDKPIKTFVELDNWIDQIWESFYCEHELRSQQGDGLLQSKFYKEGSCATIVSGWATGSNDVSWCSYGDSVIFHFNRSSKILEHSFTKLVDFSNSPMLISCKESLDESGFRSGMFHIDKDSVIFAASDALSHYVLMMYMLANRNSYVDELDEALHAHSFNSNMLQIADSLKYDFEKDVIDSIANIVDKPLLFEAKMKELYSIGVLDIDDYTIVFLKY